jgi:hypothetical protein
MHERTAIDRFSGIALAIVVIAIFAAGLGYGQDDWHAVLVIVGAGLEVAAVAYATRRIWLPSLLRVMHQRPRELESENPQPRFEGDRQGVRLFSLSEEEALVAGGVLIAGVLFCLAGSLLA